MPRGGVSGAERRSDLASQPAASVPLPFGDHDKIKGHTRSSLQISNAAFAITAMLLVRYVNVPYKYGGTRFCTVVTIFGESTSFFTVQGRWHMTEKPLTRGEIFVVDDDPAVRETLSMVLSAGGYQVICFADGAALLAVARSRTPSCILLDVHIPGKSGLDILKELHGEDYPAPIFMISGQGDITMAVSAIKNGALDFIEKPFRGSEIVARLDEAIEAYARRQANDSASRIASLHFPGREPLTRREREVLEQFTSGASNKEAGRHLGISPRTIEDHRANIMKKLGARNAADLIRIVMTTSRAS
jgi:FixJ family two-component response regulator